MMRFDRFTERAQDAAARAYEILQRYGHNQVDTEHILLALLEQPEGAIPKILEKLGVDQEPIRRRLDDALHAIPKAAIYGGGAGQVFITPRVKRVIDLANEEAQRLGDDFISTEHLFLSLLSERNTAAARILSDAGITKERVAEIIESEGHPREKPAGSRKLRVSVDLTLDMILEAIEHLSPEEARQVYDRLQERREKKD
jgi:ATP-dependent Clp protease ATP-binding subunit ClpC